MTRVEKGFEDIIPTATLAKLYEKQGLLKEAAAVYKALLSAEPGHIALEEALSDIEKRIGGHKQPEVSAQGKTVLSQLERWRHVVRSQKKALVQGGKKPSLLVVHGPEIAPSGLGKSQDRPGNVTPEEIESCVRSAAKESGMIAEIFHAGGEEALIQRLRKAARGCDVLIIDPGQSTAWTRPATRDALAALDIPIIEVHALNTFSGELSRHSGVSDVTTAHLAGFGKEGYGMAVRAAAQIARRSLEAKTEAVRDET